MWLIQKFEREPNIIGKASHIPLNFLLSFRVLRFSEITEEMTPQESLGLKWVQGVFSIEPQWITEIDLESIHREISESRAIQILKPMQNVQVSFLAQGAFNKLYTIQTDSDTLIMRVSLPVDPYWKTASEVATVEWIRLDTALPVPKVLAHQANRENAVGFEWILMTKIPGKTLADAWSSFDWQAKEQLVQQLAIFSSTLFRKQFRGIGNIYSSSASQSSCSDDPPQVERIVSMEFFSGDHILQNVPRGPFRSSKDWIDAR